MTEKIERLKSRYFWIHTGLLILSIVLILIYAARGVLRSGSAQDAMIYVYIERPLFSYSLAVILMVILSDKMNVRYSGRLKLVLRIIVIMITVGICSCCNGMVYGFNFCKRDCLSWHKCNGASVPVSGCRDIVCFSASAGKKQNLKNICS